MHPEDMAVCEDCGVPIGENVSALQCDHCEKVEAWKCTNCLGMSDDLYHELLNNKDLKWFCRGCSSSPLVSESQTGNNLDKVLDKVNQLVELISDWDSRMVEKVRMEVNTQLGTEVQHWKSMASQVEERAARCENKVEEYNKEMHGKIVQWESTIATLLDRTKELTCAKTDIGNTDGYTYHDMNWPRLGCTYPSQTVVDQGQVREIIVKAVNQQQEEDKEIEARIKNLVLFNIPENQSEKHEMRLKADKDFIITMCDDVAGIQITETDLVKCIRLGAFSADRIRPLLITLSNEGIKDGIMKMGKDLGRSGVRYNRIGIAHDYTPRQRDENRKLLEEAKQEIAANGESPENYKLYVTRRNMRPEVIKKKRYKVTQRIQHAEEETQSHTADDQQSHVMDN